MVQRFRQIRDTATHTRFCAHMVRWGCDIVSVTVYVRVHVYTSAQVRICVHVHCNSYVYIRSCILQLVYATHIRVCAQMVRWGCDLVSDRTSVFEHDGAQPLTLHPTPYTLSPAPCTMHPTFYTLHSAPDTPHPTSYTPHHTTYTPHPTPGTQHSHTFN